MTEEEEFEFRLRLEKEQAEQPAEEASVGKQALADVQLGLSDAMSTLAGDTYGRWPGATDVDRTPLDPASRTQTALGGNILPGLGRASGRVIAEVTPEPVKKGFSKAVDWMKQNVADSPIYGDVSLSEGLKAASDFVGPEVTQRAGEIANIASLGLGPKGVAGRRADAGFARSMEKLRDQDVKTMLRPGNINDPRLARGDVVEEGLLNKQRYIPTESEVRMYERVSDVPDVAPNRSARHNINAIEDYVDDMRTSLDDALVDADLISAQGVLDDLGGLKDKAKELPMLSSPDAGEAAKRIYNKYESILGEYTDEMGNIAARDLLQSRRDLDQWMKDFGGGNVFDPNIQSARTVVLGSLRKEINDKVAAAAPEGVDVATSLSKQSDMLSARDILQPRAISQAEGGLGRAVQTVEQKTGLAPARSPLAAVTNITNIPAMLFAGIISLGTLGKRGAIVSGLKMKQQAIKNIEGARKVGDRAAILAILNNEENYEE